MKCLPIISQNMWGQDERRSFRWSTNYATFPRTVLWYNVKFYGKKRLEGIWKVCRNFQSNQKGENRSKIAQELILSYTAVMCNMSPILHFLHSHGNIFSENMGAMSDKHGERFHQVLPRLNRDAVKNGIQILWLAAAGFLQLSNNWRKYEENITEVSV